jgi:histidinol dehydrogenase
MVRQIDVRASGTFSSDELSIRPASILRVEKAVSAIIRRVRSHGDDALRYYTKKFDGVLITSLSVSEEKISASLANADPHFLRILAEAASNIRRFHSQQRRTAWRLKEQFNSSLRQLYLPVEKVGVYVPGGKAAYPSTVLMNVIPAQVAGVKDIVLVSPPDKEGNVHRDVLTAAAILGITRIFRIGGAQAVAALAYGTNSVPRVDVVVGPGNIFVATAKKMVFGKVGIDGVAGPSEIVILADDTANAEFIASDMLAQAEHDESASSILVTPSARLAGRVQKELKKLLNFLPRKKIILSSLKRCGTVVLVKDIAQGTEIVNQIAPEHLSIVTRNSAATLKRIKHAGSIFLGNYSPVAVGDYFAGPNHVLPTERTARFSSPLSVDNFIKKSSVIQYSKRKMESVSEKVALFAEHEGLTAHAFSARLRGKRRRR